MKTFELDNEGTWDQWIKLPFILNLVKKERYNSAQALLVIPLGGLTATLAESNERG
jgi:hypothetical protein